MTSNWIPVLLTPTSYNQNQKTLASFPQLLPRYSLYTLNQRPQLPHHFLFRFYLLSEREEEREKERERNSNGREIHESVASCMLPTGDLACNPGMCPNWELNQQPLGSQASTQSTEPHQPGQISHHFLDTASALRSGSSLARW